MSRKVLFSVVVLVAMGLLAAPAVMAQAPTPSGACYAGSYLVEAFGPTVVACGTQQCTEITYTITGSSTADHAAAVVASGSTDCQTPSILDVTGGGSNGSDWFAPGEGDGLTGLGKYACHEEAAKISPNGAITSFTIKVSGARAAAPKSVAVKKGKVISSCEIVGIGDTPAGPNPFSTNLKVETLVFKGCAVKFTYNLTTGDVVSAALEPPPTSQWPACSSGTYPPGQCCDFYASTAQDLSLTLNLPGVGSLGLGQFGEGYISSGTNSCTTRVIGGKVYTWGSPCPS